MVKRILIIRFSSIGDIVLTTPVVRCLKQQIPGVELHYLTKKQFHPLLEANPYIDKIWLYQHDFKALIPQLKSKGFDYIIDLHKNYRSGFVVRQLGVRHASFPKLNIRKWLLVNLKVDLLPKVHIVDRYFEAVASMAVKNDLKGLDYFIPEGSDVPTVNLPETHQQGFIAAVIGGKHNTKIFPVDKVIEVCLKLKQPVILLGGNEDVERGEVIAAACGRKVFNSCGRYSISQSASLVKQSMAVLTNDTGLMHVAAAFGKHVVSVWGNTIPGFGMYPYMPGGSTGDTLMAEVKELSCRPCSKIGYEKCPKKHFRCMHNIETAPIFEFLNSKLPSIAKS